MAVFWVVALCSLVEGYTSTRLHGTTTQNTAIFILTAVRTSNAIKLLFMVNAEKHVTDHLLFCKAKFSE
jgi:hypothetical protein